MICAVHGCGLGRYGQQPYCNRHYQRARRNGDPVTAFRAPNGTGRVTRFGRRAFNRTSGMIYEHREIVERILGRPLKATEEVHHVNGDPLDNRNCNLVVCPNRDYHMLLHRRQRALDASGNPDFRKCVYCKQWSDPSALWFSPHSNIIAHVDCQRAADRKYSAAYRARRKEAAQ